MSTNRVSNTNTNTIKRFLGNEKCIHFIHSSCYYSDNSKLYSEKDVTHVDMFENDELISFHAFPPNNEPSIDGKIILYETNPATFTDATERAIIQGINSFYLIIKDSNGVVLYQAYKEKLSGDNSVISNVIDFRRPDQTPNIQILMRNTLLYIKTYISSYLTQLKIELKPMISADESLDSVFINNNTKFVIPSSSTNNQYLEYIDQYINGNQCGNQSFMRVYLPYDISKEHYENEFLKKRLNGTLIPFQNSYRNNESSILKVEYWNKMLQLQIQSRLKMFQSLYDCYYIEYLYNHQYYDISNDSMSLNVYNQSTRSFQTNRDATFQLNATIFDDDTIVDRLNHSLNTIQTTLIDLMKTTYTDLAQVTANNLTTFMTRTYNEYNGHKYSCAKLYANIELIKYIKSHFVRTDFNDSNMTYLRENIPNAKIIAFKLKLNQFPDESSKRTIKNVLTDDKLVHLMNAVNPNPHPSTNIVPNNYYYDSFQKKKYRITFQWIEGTSYKCIILLHKYNDANVVVPFPINIHIQFRQNKLTDSIKFVKLPIEIYYPPSTFSLFTKYDITFTMDLYFKQTHSVTLCDEYPYTRLGLMQYANEDIHYLTKMLLSNGEEKYTIENFIIFRCFQDYRSIETLWGDFNTVYRVKNANVDFDLYPYLNYIIHVDNENYIKEPRIFIKRRIISLFLYILRKIYPILFSSFSKNDLLKNFVKDSRNLKRNPSYRVIRNNNNYKMLEESPDRFTIQEYMNLKIRNILRYFPRHLDKTDWKNIFNGRLLYMIYKYSKSLKQDDKLDFNEGELLTEDIIRQRVIQWTTGLVYLPDIPPTHEQIGHLLLEKIINKDSSTTLKMRMREDVIDIWVKVLLFNREIYMKLYYGNPANVDGTTQVRTKSLDTWIKDYSNVNFSKAQEISLQNTQFLGSLYPINNNADTSRIIQWTSPRYDYTDEILNLFYSTMSCLIYVGLDCYFRCYFYIEPPLPIPDKRILGWCWSLPFIIESSEMRKIYDAVLGQAMDIALDILRMRLWNNYTDQINRQNENNLKVDDFTNNLTVLENQLTGQINGIISSQDRREKIYDIASTLQTFLEGQHLIDEEKDSFVDIDVDNNYENEYRVVVRRYCDVKLQLGLTENLGMSHVDKQTYENNIKTRFTTLNVENRRRNKEFIKRIICIAREALERNKKILKPDIPPFDLKQSDDNILPYYSVIDNTNTYIDEGISDKSEIEFIGDYMFDESVNKEDSIMVNDSKVCIELSKIVNDTNLTSEISAFPKNAMDDYTKMDSIRQMIER